MFKTVYKFDEELGKEVRVRVPLEPSDVSLNNKAENVVLTPYQFKRFIRGSAGYYLAVNAVLAYFEFNDEDAWAYYSAELEESKAYNFDVLLDFIGSAEVKPLIPNNIDVSAAAMTANWLKASTY